MKTIAKIKEDLEFHHGLSSLLEVLKNIAVSQYRTLEKKIKTYERFLTNLDGFFELIDIQITDHPFVRARSNKQMVVAVTSDSGLLGGLNMQVVNAALAELEQVPGNLVVIGDRGKVYAKERKIPFIAFSGIKDDERFSQAIQLRDYLTKKVLTDNIGYLKVVYPKSVSFTVQRVEIVPFLPFSPKFFKREAKKIEPSEVIFESTPEDVAGYAVYLWIGQKIFEIFGLSRLAEFSARYVHLEESHQKLKELDAKTRLEYFRVRHELVDRNMRELFAARSLYAG